VGPTAIGPSGTSSSTYSTTPVRAVRRRDRRTSNRSASIRLIEHVADVARRQGLDALTLTTFRDVTWNAPYYERLGFRAVKDDELGAGLRRVRDDEAAHGLDPTLRVCMWRPL
jgi:hypothetical protein